MDDDEPLSEHPAPAARAVVYLANGTLKAEIKRRRGIRECNSSRGRGDKILAVFKKTPHKIRVSRFYGLPRDISFFIRAVIGRLCGLISINVSANV